MDTEAVAVVMMVKDEADVIGPVIDHWFTQGIDFMLVADNLSMDDTPNILSDKTLHYPLIVEIDHDPAHYQSRKMTKLAHKAAQMGAQWIIPCDADEIWYSWNGGSVCDELRNTNQEVIGVPMWIHLSTSEDRQSANPFERMVWREGYQNPLDKIAYRYHATWTITDGNHGIKNEYGQQAIGQALPLGIRHFPYRTPEQFVRKVRNGAAAINRTDLPRNIGAHWRIYGEWLEVGGEDALIDHFNRWFYRREPAANGMVYDPAPLKVRV